ncbi:MAG TPA: heparinase II/III family protein [Allosphingosinicella sp.]
MSVLERIEADEGLAEIEPGKRLICVGSDHGASLSERLSYRLHRMSWKTPLHSFRLRGRFPVKLLSVPKDPVAGNKVRGEAILKGRLCFGEECFPLRTLDFNDPALSQRCSDYLQSFAWLRDLAAAANRDKAFPIAERLTRNWLQAYGNEFSERAWRPDLWGLRILFWTAYSPYILQSKDLVHRSSILNTLARGARHLDKTADKAAAGLPRIAAWSGVIASALVVQGVPGRLARGESGLIRALAATLHDDGGIVSRSPLEQLVLVELLSQLRAVYIAGRRELPQAAAEALSGSVAALLAVTMGDEALGNWQGGNMLSRRRVAAAIEGSGVRARPLRQARGWGYHRLDARGSVVVFDAAPPPASRTLTGGCASTLAFEFSDGEERLIVNCGGVGWAKTDLPPELLQALRTTAAHSTLTLGDRNSTAIHTDGTLGKGVGQVELSREDIGGGASVEGVHDGYVRRFGLLHRRQLTLSAEGRELRGEDSLVSAGRRRRAGPLAFAIRFHLAPSVEVTTTADGSGALLRIRGGPAWQFRCQGGMLSIEDSLWIDGSARPNGSLQLVIGGETPADGMTVSWRLRRAI